MFAKTILKTMFNHDSRIRVSFLILVLLFTLTGFHPVQAAGLIYYVDKTNPSCSDSGTGLTTTLPFCTIGKGASVAIAGDTVHVLAGSYAETITIPNSGSAGNPITLSAEPGVTVTGNGLSAFSSNAFRMIGKSYIVVDGFTITNTLSYGIYVSGSTAITISHNHVTYSGLPASGSTRAGIFFDGTNNSTIAGNTTDHNSADGITLRNGSSNNTVNNNVSFANAEQWQRNAIGIHVNGAASAQNTIIHNITYANEDSGLQFYNGTHDNIVVGNLSYGNGDHGIDNSNSTNNIVVGNTVQGNYTAGINFEGTLAPGSSGATIMGNISVDNGINPSTGVKYDIRVDALSISGTSMDYNLVYLSGPGPVIHWNGTSYTTLAAFQAAVPGQEVHGLQANPLFVSPVPYASTQPPAVVVGDYHIQAGSLAIDSANSDAPYEPPTDIEGMSRVDDPATTDTGAGVRTYDDRGAYEFQPPAESPAAVTTQAVTDITPFTATGNGNVTNMGVPAPNQHGVVWSTAPNPTTSDSKTTDGPVSATGAFTSSITGLTPNTLYHVRAYATNSAGTVYGEDVTFTTTVPTDEYTLTLNIVGNGAVAVDPVALHYHYGDVVTLSATPELGWSFSAWSGDVSSTTNPLAVTITSNTTITATFAQDEYTLSIVSPHGTVTKTPNQPTYHYGDVVTLAVTPNTGWAFTGWTPALTNNQVIMTGNITVTANYTNKFTLTIVSDHGTVTKSPNQATYRYGDVVTLTVTPDPGWTFTSWTPALTNNQVVMTGNITVTANYFTQNGYTLNVVSAHGTVTKTPDQQTYQNGDVVTLAVTPDPGWTFTGWTPALTNNQVTITGDTTVTANYIQNEYTLTVVSAHGTVTKSPNQQTYHNGDVVTLAVTPDPGWTFTGWTPVLTNNQVTISGNTTVSANYTQNEYTLTIVSAQGTVTKSPNQTTYHYGDVVTLAVTPDPGWTFASWTPVLINNQVTISGDTTVTANYTQNEYSLTVVSAHGTVSKSPNQQTYHYGDAVTLAVTPDPGWTFTSWTPALTNNQVTISGNTTVTANYIQNEYTLTVVSAHGTVTKTPDQQTYHNGDVVTLAVTPDPGWTFTGWSSNVVNNQITISGNTTVTANFIQTVYTLTLSVVGSGSITANKPAPYHYGDVVTLTAVPTAGWSFSTWSGAASGSVNPYLLTINANKTVTATFMRTPVTIRGNAGLGGATLSYTGGSPVKAATDGSYSITVPYNWSGTVTPNMLNYLFTPAFRTYSNLKVNLTGQSFTAAYTVPTVVAPTGMISDTTPTYTFIKIPGATQYQYQLFSGTTLKYTQTVLATACGTTANCLHTPTTNLLNGAYTWKVRAMIGGIWYPFSAVKSFTIYAVPMAIAPTSTISDSTPTYIFTKIPGATQYQYQLFSGTTLKYTQTVLATACGTTSNCVQTPTTVLVDGTYTWKVRAMIGGIWYPISAAKAFRLTTIPTLVAPAGTISDTTPTYTFAKISRATQYQYQLFKGTTLIYTQSVLASACGTTSNCVHTPATVLTDGAYTWKARAMVDGVWKAFSPSKAFSITTVPTLVAPASTISDTTPTYTFAKISRATQYQYQLFKGTSLIYTQSVLTSACGTTANCVHTPATVLTDGAYTWKARAMVDGVWKAFSPSKAFSITTVPTLVAPAGAISDTTPTYIFAKIPRATQYQYQLFKGTTLIYTQSILASACGTTANCVHTPAAVLAKGVYTWKARAVVDGAWKVFSPVKTFTLN